MLSQDAASWLVHAHCVLVDRGAVNVPHWGPVRAEGQAFAALAEKPRSLAQQSRWRLIKC